MKKGKDSFYAKYVKRVLDIICALLATVILSPMLLTISVLIRIKLGSPVLFKQERIGKDEKLFIMFKFRSMTNEKDEEGVLLPDVDRISKFGRFLRASSIDELPSLLNILRGNMSFVGPRPLPTAYLPYFYENERKRHSVRGGLSGLAQINGRNALSWEEKFRFDINYVDEISFILDVRVVFATLKKVLERSDIGLRGVSGPEDFHRYRMKQQESK